MKRGLDKGKMTLLATVVAAVGLYVASCIAFDGFFTLRVFLNFFGDNAFLGIAAIGMTFVILSGGIDLSVGAMIGCCSIVIAVLIETSGWHPAVAFAFILVAGTLFGAGMGWVIHVFRQPPFLVTLAGMFLARGLGFTIQMESIAIQDDFLRDLGLFHVGFGTSGSLTTPALVFFAVFVVAVIFSIYTRFGRAVYAVGGSESSALLMGLPVGFTKIRVYAFSGFCSSLAGIVYTLYTFSGNPTAGNMLELDAIAAVVIGGTLLSGGVGTVFGTFLGVLIFGIIQTAVIFQGRLSSWWTRIAIGGLLLAFILLQRALQRRTH